MDESGVWGRLALTNVATALLIVLSAFGVIHSTYTCRGLYARLQVLESDQWHMQEHYRRLLIEQSTLASYQRVEAVARGELDMRAPDLASFKVVSQ